MDPFALSAFDIANGVFYLAAAVLLVCAVISLIRVADRLTGKQALLWFLLILVVPVVGPLVWFFVGYRRLRER